MVSDSLAINTLLSGSGTTASTDRISSISSINSVNSIESILSLDEENTTKDNTDFASVLQNALSNTLNDTQTLIDSAEEAEIEFALGNSDNTHDLQIAQQKANIAVSYTVAVRDKLLDAYKEIMNMQF